MMTDIQQIDIHNVFSAQVQGPKAVFEQNIQYPLLDNHGGIWVAGSL